MISSRYIRNIGTITEEEQAILHDRSVFIAGGGGLGGYIFSLLLRIGIGRITIIDGDSFDETNLNRQLLCSLSSLGQSKAQTAAQYAQEIDPSVQVTALQVFLDEANCASMIEGHDLVIDALDNIESRKVLARNCDRLGIPLVYGAISGWNAQAGFFPAGKAAQRMEFLYPEGTVITDKSCLSFTPSLCASLEAAETVKYLLGKESLLSDRILYIDLLDGEFEEIPFFH